MCSSEYGLIKFSWYNKLRIYGNRSVLYESAACYMETAAVLYENVFESMSRITVS